jgi:hypothetical protein
MGYPVNRLAAVYVCFGELMTTGSRAEGAHRAIHWSNDNVQVMVMKCLG